MARKLIITTSGTSLLDKRGTEGMKDRIQQMKQALGNVSAEFLEQVLQGQISDLQAEEEAALTYLRSQCPKLRHYSAEVASLKCIADLEARDRVVLLSSDTLEGVFCARINALYINDSKLATCELAQDVKRIEDLQLEHAERFVKSGIPNLHRALEATLERYAGFHRYINFTGGFKGIIPAITLAAGSLKPSIPLRYLFEPDRDDTEPYLIPMVIHDSSIQFHQDLKISFALNVSESPNIG